MSLTFLSTILTLEVPKDSKELTDARRVLTEKRRRQARTAAVLKKSRHNGLFVVTTKVFGDADYKCRAERNLEEPVNYFRTTAYVSVSMFDQCTIDIKEKPGRSSMRNRAIFHSAVNGAENGDTSCSRGKDKRLWSGQVLIVSSDNVRVLRTTVHATVHVDSQEALLQAEYAHYRIGIQDLHDDISRGESEGVRDGACGYPSHQS